MSGQGILVMLLAGGVAGWLAGLAMRGRGFGLIGNIVIGIIGALLGGFLLRLLGIHIGGSVLVAAILNAFIGAVVLLFLLGLARGRR